MEFDAIFMIRLIILARKSKILVESHRTPVVTRRVYAACLNVGANAPEIFFEGKCFIRDRGKSDLDPAEER